ncbi:hypothetical protein [Hymenobacter daeguensis]
MPVEMQLKLMKWLETFMQVSILAPMLVTWWRGRSFAPPVRLVSKYVYLSAASVIIGKLAAHYLHNNLLILVGFNMGKMLLFAAVYKQVLLPGRAHTLLRWSVALVLCIAAGLLLYDWKVASNAARIMQITVLAGYALVYLDQTLHPANKLFNTYNPIWLLSVANLLYAAFAATAANIGIFSPDSAYYFAFICLASLNFNGFLTLALLRAQPDNAELPDASSTAATTLATA